MDPAVSNVLIWAGCFAAAWLVSTFLVKASCDFCSVQGLSMGTAFILSAFIVAAEAGCYYGASLLVPETSLGKRLNFYELRLVLGLLSALPMTLVATLLYALFIRCGVFWAFVVWLMQLFMTLVLTALIALMAPGTIAFAEGLSNYPTYPLIALGVIVIQLGASIFQGGLIQAGCELLKAERPTLWRAFSVSLVASIIGAVFSFGTLFVFMWIHDSETIAEAYEKAQSDPIYQIVSASLVLPLFFLTAKIYDSGLYTGFLKACLLLLLLIVLSIPLTWIVLAVMGRGAMVVRILLTLLVSVVATIALLLPVVLIYHFSVRSLA